MVLNAYYKTFSNKVAEVSTGLTQLRILLKNICMILLTDLICMSVLALFLLLLYLTYRIVFGKLFLMQIIKGLIKLLIIPSRAGQPFSINSPGLGILYCQI